jgi:hypothetical protein
MRGALLLLRRGWVRGGRGRKGVLAVGLGCVIEDCRGTAAGLAAGAVSRAGSGEQEAAARGANKRPAGRARTAPLWDDPWLAASPAREHALARLDLVCCRAPLSAGTALPGDKKGRQATGMRWCGGMAHLL